MSRWTLKQRWYGREEWLVRRIVSAMLVFTMCFGPGFPFAAFANPDTFVGDSAIYIGAPAERVRPKVLFLIDNSRATEDPASGSEFFPSVIYPPISGREPWDVFSAKNTGEFSQGALDNTSYALDDLTADSCADIIREKLVFSGTYSSSGSNDAPNIKNGNCSTSPNGAVYAIGNYLNYLQYDPWNSTQGCFDDDLDNVCDEDDICRGYMDDFSVKTYAEIQAAYASYGMAVPASFPVGVGAQLYDMDNDGVPNGLPGSPWPDGCDLCLSGDDSQDQDFDTIPDACDQCGLPIDCPTCSGAYFDDSIDADNNGTPDCLEADADGDGIVNGIDVCVGANTVDDADSDGVPDDCDAFPADPNEAIDSDGDGVGDESDQCPGFPDSNDLDTDGTPDGCDADIDNDGIPNANDNCPAYNSVDTDQTDTDNGRFRRPL